MHFPTLILAISTLICAGCLDPKPLEIDVSESTVELKMNRLEEDMFQASLGPEQLREKHPDFFDLYATQILKLPSENDSLLTIALTDFRNNKEIREVYDTVNKSFSDFKKVQDQLELGFSHYKHYFPDKIVPEITTLISGFNYSIVCTEKQAGISLEMYLGSNVSFYSLLGFPRYKTSRMSSEYIPADVLKGWGQTEFEPEEEMKTFLEKIIFHGKVLYFLDAMYPEMHDSLKIGYTNEQLEFCKKNEVNIWALFIEKDLLFSNKKSEYEKYLNEGPTTNGLPRESPAMIGIWTGWQIVRKFMNDEKDMTLSKLMEEKDAQSILNRSKYKPK